MNNPQCDGARPHVPGQTAYLPLPGGAGVYLCARCWAAEMAWRVERNRELAPDARYDITGFPAPAPEECKP